MKSHLKTEGHAHSRVNILNIHSSVYLLNEVIHYVPITLLSPGLLHINNIEPLPSSPSGSNRKTDEK